MAVHQSPVSTARKRAQVVGLGTAGQSRFRWAWHQNRLAHEARYHLQLLATLHLIPPVCAKLLSGKIFTHMVGFVRPGTDVGPHE